MSNFFQQAFSGILDPSTYRGDNKLNGSHFYQIGSFFGYDFGSVKASSFIKAFASNALVYMIVNRIAENTASLERKYTNSQDKEIEGGAIQTLLDNPNPRQGRIELYETAGEFLLSTGNLFFLYTEGIGMGAELSILNSSRMRLDINSIGQPLRWMFTDDLGNEIPYELDEILHVKTSNIVEVANSNVFFGLSP